jgi:hypothetical protein
MSSLRKNVAGQVFTFCLVNATTGAALTGATVTAKLSIDGAAQVTAGGTVTELAGGQYKFAPSQADTNGTSLGFLFTATSAIPVNIQIFTIGYDPTVANLPANVTQWNGTNVSAPATAGIPDVNVKNIVNTAAAVDANNLLKVDVEDWKGGIVPAVTVTGVPKVDVADWNGAAVAAPNVAGVPKVDVVDWLGTAPAAPNVAGVPKVDLVDWLGSAPSALSSGLVQAAISGNVTVGGYAGGQDPATLVFAATMTEAYPTKGAAFTLPQAAYAIVQHISEMSISNVTETVKKRDQATTAKTYTLNDATNPTSITEAT